MKRRMTLTEAIEEAIRISRLKFGRGGQTGIAEARHFARLFRAILGRFTAQFEGDHPVRKTFIRKFFEDCERQAARMGLRYGQPATRKPHKKKLVK